MAQGHDDDDDIPLLDDILRPGNGPPKRGNPTSGAALSREEIEAIAARVVEEYVPYIEAAIVRAIHSAMETTRESGEDPETPGE